MKTLNEYLVKNNISLIKEYFSQSEKISSIDEYVSSSETISLIKEYLIGKNKKQHKSSSIDTLAEELPANVFQDKQYKVLFDVMKDEKYHGYTEAMCDVILDLYNDDYDYIFESPARFKNIDENFKGFRITSKGWNHDSISFEIYNVEKLVQLHIEFLKNMFTIRRGNARDQEELINALSSSGSSGMTFIGFCSDKYESNKPEELKRELYELIK